MEALEKLFKKKKKLIVGLMSGTSADGIDATLVEILGSRAGSKIRQLAFQTYSYPQGFKAFLLKNSNPETARLDDVTRLNMLVAMFFANAARRVAHKGDKRLDEIDLIGTHGQTIQHLPLPERLFGKSVRATLQLGNPSVIAKLTGVVTVGDFRMGDIAVGGSGAPLIPLFDYFMLRSERYNRAALNIGGIANFTVLPRRCTLKKVLAFDTGPGNMVIDGLMQKFFRKTLDSGGVTALRGRILPHLLRWMSEHPYLRVRPPKSTGREIFGETFIKQILARGKNDRKEDLIATATEFTALSIYQQYLRFVRKETKIDELIVSGGGVHNRYLMNALQRYFHGVDVWSAEHLNLSSDAKEAICFALLANETIAGNPTNIPGATGALRQTVLGSICLP